MSREREREGCAMAKRERKKSKYLSPPYTTTAPSPLHAATTAHAHDDPLSLSLSLSLSLHRIFHDFLCTAVDPLFLKRNRSARLLRFFFRRYRDAAFLRGTHYAAYAHLQIPPHLGLSPPSSSPPKMPHPPDASTLKQLTPTPTPGGQKRGRPTKEQESQQLMGSVSSIPHTTDHATVSNFANAPYQFLHEARAHMIKTNPPENGNNLHATANQSQQQGISNQCDTANGDATGEAGSQKKGRKRKIAQPHYPNPAALLLHFSNPDTTSAAAIAPAMNLPSRDHLLSTFSNFGLLVEAQSDVHPDSCTARVVFARSADAQAAYNSPDKMGAFGPPYASCHLHYLPPISEPETPAQRAQAHKMPAQQPSTKPQLCDIRKNLEIMISSLAGASGSPVKVEPGSTIDGIRPEVRGSLLEEMQALLMKVEKRLGDSSASS